MRGGLGRRGVGRKKDAEGCVTVVLCPRSIPGTRRGLEQRTVRTGTRDGKTCETGRTKMSLRDSSKGMVFNPWTRRETTPTRRGPVMVLHERDK